LVGPNEVNDLKTIILAMETGSIGDSPAVVVPVATKQFDRRDRGFLRRRTFV